MGNEQSKKAAHEALVSAETRRMVTVHQGSKDETIPDEEQTERVLDEALLAQLASLPELTPILRSDLDQRWVSRADRRRNDIEKMGLTSINPSAVVDSLATIQTSLLRNFDAASQRQEDIEKKMKSAEQEALKARGLLVTAVASLRTFNIMMEECVVVSKAVEEVHGLCQEVHDVLLKIEALDATLLEAASSEKK